MSGTTPRFLVCAGSTHQPIDRVRAWGNIFTGETGLRVARALAAYGPVDLLTSNPEHRARLAADAGCAHPICAHGFVSHADLGAALDALMAEQRYAAVSMSAAVSDYSPAGCFALDHRQPNADGSEWWVLRDVQRGKVGSGHARIAVLGEPTEKIVDRFRGRYAYAGLLVKFKLEVDIAVDELLTIGEASRQASGADLLVANSLDMVTGPVLKAWLLDGTTPRELSRAELPNTLAATIAERLGLSATKPLASSPALLLADWCRSLAATIERLSPAAYTRRQDGASIGEHLRHGLDHLGAVIAGAEHGLIDFERRRRGWQGERESALAVAELRAQATALAALAERDPTTPVVVRVIADPQAEPLRLTSTWGRELVAVLSHEIHHAAILRPRLEAAGLELPASFGVAPSTVAFREQRPCAASA